VVCPSVASCDKKDQLVFKLGSRICGAQNVSHSSTMYHIVQLCTTESTSSARRGNEQLGRQLVDSLQTAGFESDGIRDGDEALAAPVARVRYGAWDIAWEPVRLREWVALNAWIASAVLA
jgi:hypothetical protein